MKFLFSSLEDALLLRTLLHWRTAAQSTTPRLELSALTKRELTEPLEALGGLEESEKKVSGCSILSFTSR